MHILLAVKQTNDKRGKRMEINWKSYNCKLIHKKKIKKINIKGDEDFIDYKK